MLGTDSDFPPNDLGCPCYADRRSANLIGRSLILLEACFWIAWCGCFPLLGIVKIAKTINWPQVFVAAFVLYGRYVFFITSCASSSRVSFLIARLPLQSATTPTAYIYRVAFWASIVCGAHDIPTLRPGSDSIFVIGFRQVSFMLLACKAEALPCANKPPDQARCHC